MTRAVAQIAEFSCQPRIALDALNLNLKFLVCHEDYRGKRAYHITTKKVSISTIIQSAGAWTTPVFSRLGSMLLVRAGVEEESRVAPYENGGVILLFFGDGRVTVAGAKDRLECRSGSDHCTAPRRVFIENCSDSADCRKTWFYFRSPPRTSGFTM
jgi:hypothetical protein